MSKPMPTTYAELLNAILADPNASGWLKVNARTLNNRDPVDAKRDADTLFTLQRMRWHEVQREAAERSKP